MDGDTRTFPRPWACDSQRYQHQPDTPAPPTLVPATAYLFILYMRRVFNISNPIITKFINRVRWSERLLAGEICL